MTGIGGAQDSQQLLAALYLGGGYRVKLWYASVSGDNPVI